MLIQQSDPPFGAIAVHLDDEVGVGRACSQAAEAARPGGAPVPMRQPIRLVVVVDLDLTGICPMRDHHPPASVLGGGRGHARLKLGLDDAQQAHVGVRPFRSVSPQQLGLVSDGELTVEGQRAVGADNGCVGICARREAALDERYRRDLGCFPATSVDEKIA